ncbi:MAG: enoyl-CoA hydratase/isomerase family protein [Epsilonproteobacteria bacterium]|nr:MAG: enoyl-CoA hydratase/isomerase family protein [Campylobacterota bacterium]RLA64611.1 MAG: enoyl-CoA hydratase/isomerase family protein [Campylobacterota bacterium]
MVLDKKIDNKGVVLLTLNRPKARNALNVELIEELTTTFEHLDKNDDVRIIVITGAGDSFCAGADLKDWKNSKDFSESQNFESSLKLASMFKTINDCQKPVIAQVNGHALGGGLGLIAVCDYVLCSSKAKIGMPEVHLGLIPAVISPYVIAKIGETNARAYFLSGIIFFAQKAETLGLVHDVYQPDKLGEETSLVVKQFLKAGPIALREAKILIKNLTLKIDAKNIDYTCETIARLRVSPEAQEGMNALLEKRAPNWVK